MRGRVGNSKRIVSRLRDFEDGTDGREESRDDASRGLWKRAIECDGGEPSPKARGGAGHGAAPQERIRERCAKNLQRDARGETAADNRLLSSGNPRHSR